jgi:putative endonuclease
MVTMSWFVYVLLCEDGSLYTGSSNDVEKRFMAHQAGRGGRYTRAHKVVKILYSEEFTTRSEAVKREEEIKSWTRQEKIQKLKLVI